MRSSHSPVAAALLIAGIAACSSSSTDKTKAPLRDGGGSSDATVGSGGKAGAAGGSAAGGKAGSGGGTGSGGVVSGAGGHKPGTGGADPKDCALDSGTDECRNCLASFCCGDFLACLGDSACKKGFDTYQTCVKASNGDANKVSECFSTFASTISGGNAALTTCDFNSCSVECGGPIPL